MQLFSTITQTKTYLQKLKNEGKTIGFVPTMGALHNGHLELLKKAKKENNIAVSSIFVNPLQFNDKKDLEKYPRTLEKDAELLKREGCDIVFAPNAEEMYGKQPETAKNHLIYDLGTLDKVMEGAHRPGHFQGVCVVVHKLFEIVQPTKAYFGEKDFQQLAIIRHMVKQQNIPVEVIPCPTVRESDGLAMSSRNMLLSSEERKNAPLIYKTLSEAKAKKDKLSVPEVIHWVTSTINSNPHLSLEYYEIVNAETLQPVTDWTSTKNLRACIAVKAGSVRLIDNIPM